MMERRLDSIQEAAAHLLDTLEAGQDVTLEITARDAETKGLLRLITELHELAVERRVGITMAPAGERRICLTLMSGDHT